MPERKIISEHKSTPRRERVVTNYAGEVIGKITPVPRGKKRVEAIVDGQTKHIDIDQ